MNIHVDGSGLGIGLWVEGDKYFFETEGVTTNTNEAHALVLGLKYAVYHKKSAVLHSDSKTAIAVAMKGYSSVDHLTKYGIIAKRLRERALTLGLTIEIIWIPGKANQADAPSRMKGEYLEGWAQDFINI